jgi:hypothetical protein
MAKARFIGPTPPKRMQFRVGNGGYTHEEVQAIVARACMDPRFCEVRSWSDGSGDRHWEAVALVPASTMYEAIGADLGDSNWTSPATFSRCLPDYYVERKKERCVCNYCKKGWVCISRAVSMVNMIRRLLSAKNWPKEEMDEVRGLLLDLRGHLEKELVVQVVGERHLDECATCSTPNVVASKVLRQLNQLNRQWLLPTTKEEWSTTFPGEAFPARASDRVAAVKGFFETFVATIETYKNHLQLKSDRIKAYESDLAALSMHKDREVWIVDYAMSRRLQGSYYETEEQFLSRGNAEELGVLRVFWDDSKQSLMCGHYLFLFEGGKDGQTTLQILRRLLSNVQAHRTETDLLDLREVRIWSDNAHDLKGGDIWDQWKKILEDESVTDGTLGRVVLQYHAKNEGKTRLDGFFGRQASVLNRFERLGHERSGLDDLFNVYKSIPTSHVNIIEIQRDSSSAFYRTAQGISDLHSVHITRDAIVAQKNSTGELLQVDLDKVKAHQGKRHKAEKQRREQEEAKRTEISTNLCQKCQHGVKKGEDLSEWIQCDDCDRSWHKTCVGIDKDTDPLTLGFMTCTKCGGADPEGMTLEKKRKVPHCDFCHKPKKGNDHKHCKAAKEQAANAYRTPMCDVLQSSVHPVAFTNFHEPNKTRARRKRRKRRVHGKVVSAEEYLDRKSRL